jgi:hypothetical protein
VGVKKATGEVACVVVPIGGGYPLPMNMPTKRDAFRRLAAIPIATVIDVGVAEQTDSLIAAYPEALHLLIEPDIRWHATYAKTYAGIDYVPHVMAANTVNRIDSLSFNGPALLKIDVDGGELAVLRGSTNCLEKLAVLVVEANAVSLFAIVQFAEAHGFRLFDVVELCYCGNQLHQCDLMFVANPFCPLVFTPWDIRYYQHFE